jgi:hypothetical protein
VFDTATFRSKNMIAPCLGRAFGGALLLATLGIGSAQAALSIVPSVGGAPTGVTRWNLDVGSPAPAGVTVTLTPDAAFVTGSQSGLYAAPFLSGNNGVGFGPGGTDQPNGVDTTQYLTTGSTGAFANAMIEIAFSTPQRYFGLLWGSVDDYNTLEFFNGNVSVGVLTGLDVTPNAVGNQGEQGTFYVNINSTLDFDRLVFTSSQYAFEFDNIAFNQDEVSIPEPTTLGLLGAGLIGLGLARRRRAG